MRKLVVLTASAVAAGTIGLISAGPATSQPANPNQTNVIGEPYYKAKKILEGMGMKVGFGGAVGDALPQAQCMVASQKPAGQRMLLNLDCTKQAAEEMAASGSLGTGGASPGMPNDGTLRPPQIPIAAQPAPAPAPAG